MNIGRIAASVLAASTLTAASGAFAQIDESPASNPASGATTTPATPDPGDSASVADPGASGSVSAPDDSNSSGADDSSNTSMAPNSDDAGTINVQSPDHSSDHAVTADPDSSSGR